jgi:hypothetical protein
MRFRRLAGGGIAPAAAIIVLMVLGAGPSAKANDTARTDIPAPLRLSAENAPFPDLHETSLALNPPPVRSETPSMGVMPKEQALVPLPPAAWTGMTGLAAVTLVRSRKAVLRFLSS